MGLGVVRHDASHGHLHCFPGARQDSTAVAVATDVVATAVGTHVAYVIGVALVDNALTAVAAPVSLLSPFR